MPVNPNWLRLRRGVAADLRKNGCRDLADNVDAATQAIVDKIDAADAALDAELLKLQLSAQTEDEAENALWEIDSALYRNHQEILDAIPGREPVPPVVGGPKW